MATIDASTMTGAFVMEAAEGKATIAITTGSGADTVYDGSGANTIVTGAGQRLGCWSRVTIPLR